MRAHAPRVPYVEYDEVEAACPECGRLFRSADALEAHVADSHATVVPAVRPPRSVKCSVCGARFPTTSAHSRHNRSAHTS